MVDTAREIYPRIARSTEMAVEFTERYEDAAPEVIEEKLARDLSVLGEEVITRIELEDKLIAAMLGTKYQIPASPAVN